MLNWQVCGCCRSEVVDGIVRNGVAFCDSDCADKVRRETADAAARAEGYTSYEDQAEHEGIAAVYVGGER